MGWRIFQLHDCHRLVKHASRTSLLLACVFGPRHSSTCDMCDSIPEDGAGACMESCLSMIPNRSGRPGIHLTQGFYALLNRKNL